MPATVTTLSRVFNYRGTQLPDPGPSLTPHEAVQVLSAAHPALTNSLLEGPVVEGGKHVFTIKVQAGTKG